mmetsp:Transcript_3173/g.9682  ORF Transcript_3173/g.9682 Transcript_3173/m.9682 type:complete len:255 (-) Transcript_3173:99-863(-)
MSLCFAWSAESIFLPQTLTKSCTSRSSIRRSFWLKVELRFLILLIAFFRICRMALFATSASSDATLFICSLLSRVGFATGMLILPLASKTGVRLRLASSMAFFTLLFRDGSRTRTSNILASRTTTCATCLRGRREPYASMLTVSNMLVDAPEDRSAPKLLSNALRAASMCSSYTSGSKPSSSDSSSTSPSSTCTDCSTRLFASRPFPFFLYRLASAACRPTAALLRMQPVESVWTCRVRQSSRCVAAKDKNRCV